MRPPRMAPRSARKRGSTSGKPARGRPGSGPSLWPIPGSRRQRSRGDARVRPGSARESAPPHPGEAGSPARFCARDASERRGRPGSPPRTPGAATSLPHSGPQHVAPEALSILEDEPAIGAVVVPDLERWGLCGGRPGLDLVGRAVLDVDPPHVGAPPGPVPLEVLLGIMNPPEELQHRFVATRLRGRIAAPPEVLPALCLLLRGERAQRIDLAGLRDVGQRLEHALELLASWRAALLDLERAPDTPLGGAVR